MYRLILFVFLIVSCSGQRQDKKSGPVPARILSEEEKQRLVTPTVYYIPRYTLVDHQNCSIEDKIDLIDIYEQLIVSSCRRVYKSCEMQGTCQVQLADGSNILINVDQRNDRGRRTFQKVTSSQCVYGLGASTDRKMGYRQMCIDPFYSVAADLSIYNLGDVIFIPMLKGLILPNGEAHTGYVIVRDSGQRIKGVGRFDFFTGYLGMTRTNPFFKIGLGGGDLFPEYFVVQGGEANRIRAARNFPLLINGLNRLRSPAPTLRWSWSSKLNLPVRSRN